MKLFLLLILLTSNVLSAPQDPTTPSSKVHQRQSDPFIHENKQKRAQNPEGLIFTIRLKHNGTKFNTGEIIPLELSFSSSVPRRFILDSASYDRSGRLDIDDFILDREEDTVDPLHDYFFSGLFGFMGGGLHGMPELSEKPEVLTAELNEWIRFDKPGHYRLYVVSDRVSKKRNPDDQSGNHGTPVVSNVVEFDIVPADKKWSNQKLKEAVTALAKRDSENQRAACRILRFLGTEMAASEMIKRFRGNDDNCDFQYQFGLISSPQRDFVIREMERAFSSTEQPITFSFISTLSLLAFTKQAPETPGYPNGNDEQNEQWHAQMRERRDSYDQSILNYLRQLVAAIPEKQEDAQATSLQTLLDYQTSLKTSDQVQLKSLLATLPDVFGRLPLDEQVRLLTYQWKPIASNAMLPVLREILRQPDNTNSYKQRDLRSIALRRLYELSPAEGRRLIIDQIVQPKPRVNRNVLRSLPDKEMPELEDVLATNLEQTRQPNSSGNAEAISDLIERYATAGILPRVRVVYEGPGVGKWACRIQSSLLAYILRTDPSSGGELLNKALSARGEAFTGCYASALTEVSKLHMSAEVENAANSLLEESDSEIASQAANVLGQYGSADAEEKLWQRLQKWHDEMRSQAGALSKQHPGVPRYGSSVLSGEAMIEQALRNALSNGQAWLADLEKLKRLRTLCLTDFCRNELDNMIKGWNQDIHFSQDSFDDRQYSITIAHYNFNTLEALKQKLTQFPQGTLFIWQSMVSGDDASKEQQIFQQLKSYLEEHGMKLERERELH